MKPLQIITAGLLVSAACFSGIAQAQPSDADKSTARQLAIAGLEALEKKDFARAADRFGRADALFPAPTVTLGLARARRGLGQLVAAQEAYSRLLHAPVTVDASAVFRQAMEDARVELAALAPKVPSVIIEVKGVDAPKVTLDGADVPVAALGVPRSADPGKHVVRAAAPGFITGESTVELAEGASQRVTLELRRGEGSAAALAVTPAVAPGSDSGPAPKSSQRVLGMTTAGVGAAGLLLGGIVGGLALSKHSTLAKECPSGHCAPTAKPDLDSYHTLTTVSTAGFIGGGVLAAAGVVLMVTVPKAKLQTATITPMLGLGYLGAQGTF